MLLANRIALVSGAAGGRAIAVRFAGAGAGLIALRRTAGGMTETAKGFRRLKAWKQSSLPAASLQAIQSQNAHSSRQPKAA